MHETRPRLGQMLVDARILTPEQLEQVLALQKVDGRRLGTLLVEIGLVTETQLTQVLSQQLSVPWVSLYHIDFSRELLSLIPRETAEKYCLVPIYVRPVRGLGDTLYVAMDDPMNEDALVACSCSAGLPTRAMIAAPSDIRKAIRFYYAGAQSMPTTRGPSVRATPEDGGVLLEPMSPPAAESPPASPPHSERSALGAFLTPASAPKGGLARPGEVPISDAVAPGSLAEAVTAASVQAAQGSAPPLADEDAVLIEHDVEEGEHPASGQAEVANAPRQDQAASPSDEQGVPTPTFLTSSTPVDTAEGLALSIPADSPPAELPGQEPAAPETPRVSLRDDAPELEIHEIEIPKRPSASAKRRSLTLLDGTTIAVGAPPTKKRARPGGVGREPTAADVVAALRAAYHRDAAREERHEDARWEKVIAALLSLLLRKHLILDAEFIEELKKI